MTTSDHFRATTSEEAEAVAAAAGQLEAYNARDVEAFCRWFGDDVEVLTLGVAEPVFSGMAAFRARYADAFTREPQVRCAIEHRHVLGRFVTDYEFLTGFRDGGTKRAVAIYETRGGKIVRVWFVPG